ncbi:MAG: hypothetical protein JW904_02105 [Spirochaetales bacterium]|nr:hypothetical protein [Spirochaetales bacterium]
MSQELAIKKEYQHLLHQQKNNIEDYIHLLQQAAEAIESGDQEKIEYYTSLERVFTDKISGSHRTIQQFANMNSDANEDSELLAFEGEITALLEKALDINKQNRQLLKERMQNLKIKMAEVQKKIKAKGGYLSPTNDDPQFIDISS